MQCLNNTINNINCPAWYHVTGMRIPVCKRQEGQEGQEDWVGCSQSVLDGRACSVCMSEKLVCAVNCAVIIVSQGFRIFWSRIMC
jgi:hypothetical protein